MLRLPVTALLFAAAALPIQQSDAETLRGALTKAYETNPELGGARSSVRALDASVDEARSLSAPAASATAGLNQDFDTFGGPDSLGRNFSIGASVDLPLFRGGLISNSVNAAQNRLSAGQLDLSALENDIFTRATAAYEDVRRDQQVVILNRNQVRVLTEQLRASRDRFEVGDVTRTDVAQSEARLAQAESALRRAEAQLVASEEAYVRVVGDRPVALEPPPPLGELPRSSDESVALAKEGNPTLLAARADAVAAGYEVGVARAEGRPSVFASAGTRYTNYLGTLNESLGVPSSVGLDNDTQRENVGLTLSVPFYTGGRVPARVRQAREFRTQAELAVLNAERAVTESARNAYERLIAARSVIRSAEEQVRANEIALEGVRAENSVGLRTVLDVLDAEQELLNSRVELVRARREEYVAGFVLLATTGRATAEGLNLEVGTPTVGPPPPPRARAKASTTG